MPMYEPGVYAFDLEIYDPDRTLPPFRYLSNVNVDRRMNDNDIAQILFDSARSDYPNAPALGLANPKYRLRLKRR